jgi:hypothetical protein
MPIKESKYSDQLSVYMALCADPSKFKDVNVRSISIVK